jgi:Lrp/AsnC family transcriptional regulator, leucine-responsive regulatory protein
MQRDLDEIDLEILSQLQNNSRISHSEIAQKVELSITGLQKRLRKLEAGGVIKKYVTLMDQKSLGYDLLCFIQITLHRHEPKVVEKFMTSVQKIPEILECYHITGGYDYLLKVVVRNTAHLEQFLLGTLTPIQGMDRIQTSLVLSEIKSELIPLE